MAYCGISANYCRHHSADIWSDRRRERRQILDMSSLLADAGLFTAPRWNTRTMGEDVEPRLVEQTHPINRDKGLSWVSETGFRCLHAQTKKKQDTWANPTIPRMLQSTESSRVFVKTMLLNALAALTGQTDALYLHPDSIRLERLSEVRGGWIYDAESDLHSDTVSWRHALRSIVL